MSLFQVDSEVFIVHAYADMLNLGNRNIPTLYELMTEPNLDIWDNSSIIKDESRIEGKLISTRSQ